MFKQKYAPQNLLLYFDAKSQWPAVYKQNKVGDLIWLAVKISINSMFIINEMFVCLFVFYLPE